MPSNDVNNAKFVPWNSQDLNEWTKKYATGSTINLDGKPTHYIKTGDGPPLLLIHGFFGHALVWRLNIQALSEHFTVYAPDLWGLGYSTREPLDYGWKLYSRQIKLFVNAMGIEKCCIGGLSMGGGIAIQFTNDYPEMVEKLFFVDPAVFPQKKTIKDGVFAWPVVGPFLLNLPNDKLRKKVMGDKFYSDVKLITEEGYKATTWHHKIKGTTEVLRTILKSGFIGQLEPGVEELAEKSIPALITWGAKDMACTVKNAPKMQSLLKGSELEIFENAGHLPNVEEPDRFNARVIDFLLAD